MSLSDTDNINKNKISPLADTEEYQIEKQAEKTVYPGMNLNRVDESRMTDNAGYNDSAMTILAIGDKMDSESLSM